MDPIVFGSKRLNSGARPEQPDEQYWKLGHYERLCLEKGDGDLNIDAIEQERAEAGRVLSPRSLFRLMDEIDSTSGKKSYEHEHQMNLSQLLKFNTASELLISQNTSTSIPQGLAVAALANSSLSHQLLPPENSSTQPQLEALSESWQAFLIVLYSTTAITSIVLNFITVIVLSRSRGSELRKYLINLSLSDLLMSLFSIPFTYTEYMLGRWIFASFLCPVVRFVVTLSVFASAATMTVIGINRHLAIMYPFRRKKSSKFRRWTIRKIHVIIAIWVLGVAISTPEYLMFSVQPFCFNRKLYYDCRQVWSERTADGYSIFIFASTFAIPISLLTYLYTSIGIRLWRRRIPGNVDRNRDLTMQTKRLKVIKMLFVVVLLFTISWFPLQAFSILMLLYPNLRQDITYQSLEYNIFVGSYFAAHWLSMAHSCLNPLIYCFMNDKFRSDMQDLIVKKLPCPPARSSKRAHCQDGGSGNGPSNNCLDSNASRYSQQQMSGSFTALTRGQLNRSSVGRNFKTNSKRLPPNNGQADPELPGCLRSTVNSKDDDDDPAGGCSHLNRMDEQDCPHITTSDPTGWNGELANGENWRPVPSSNGGRSIFVRISAKPSCNQPANQLMRVSMACNANSSASQSRLERLKSGSTELGELSELNEDCDMSEIESENGSSPNQTGAAPISNV